MKLSNKMKKKTNSRINLTLLSTNSILYKNAIIFLSEGKLQILIKSLANKRSR